MILLKNLFLFLYATLPTALFATGPAVTVPNPIKFTDLQTFLADILNIVIQYGALIIVFFIVFAGFKFVTAQGNTEKLAEAKKMLAWIIVGAFVLLGVYVIRAAICGTLKNISGSEFTC